MLSSVRKPLEPTSNAVSVTLCDFMSVMKWEYLFVLNVFLTFMNPSNGTESSTMCTVFFALSVIVRSGFRLVAVMCAGIVPPLGV